MSVPLLTNLGIAASRPLVWNRLWTPNVLLQSNTFSSASWAKVRCSIPQAASLLAPSGALAWKFVEDNTAAANHRFNQTFAATATPWTFGKWFYAAERTSVVMDFATANVATKFTLSGAGSKGAATTTVNRPTTDYIYARGDGWYYCSITHTLAAGTEYAQVLLSNGTSETFDGTGAHTAGNGTESDPGLYIADAQLYPSATLPAYGSPTGTLQTWPDLSGHGYTLQRGATSGAEASDPVVLGPGWGFTGANYGLTGNLAGVNMATNWTAMVAASITAADAADVVWTINSSSGTYTALRWADATHLYLRSMANDGSGTTQLVISTAAILYSIVNRNGTITATRLDTGAQSTVEDGGTSGTPIIELGGKHGANTINGMTAYEHVFWNRALPPAEIQRVYRQVKGYWATQGVTIL